MIYQILLHFYPSFNYILYFLSKIKNLIENLIENSIKNLIENSIENSIKNSIRNSYFWQTENVSFSIKKIKC